MPANSTPITGTKDISATQVVIDLPPDGALQLTAAIERIVRDSDGNIVATATLGSVAMSAAELVQLSKFQAAYDELRDALYAKL